MALPVLDAVFASSADLPRRQLLSEWLVEQLGSGSIADFSTLPERYLYAKIAVSLGGPRTEQEYIELPKSYAWSDIYGAIIFNRTAPAAPSSLTLTPLTSSSIKLDWVTNGASVAYSVERSVDGAAFQVIGTTAIGATTATNTGLSIASNYQYRIRGSSGGFFTGYSNTASASTYDANASSFIATSGATDIVAINDFVLGVKTLGLWNSMVCWPLRSSQNAGTGTTAYSLGGLGTFNGTLVGGPTWGVNALDFTVNSSRMDTAVTLPIAPVALMVVRQAQQAQSNNSGIFFTAGVNVSGRQFAFSNSAATTTQNYQAWHSAWANLALNTGLNITGSTRINREYNAWRILSSSTARLSRNSTQSGSNVTVTSWDTSSPAFTKFGYYPLAGADDTLSFMAHFTAAIDNTTDAAFYTLYKQTLGQGLGLP